MASYETRKFVDRIIRLLERGKMTRLEFARRLDVRPSYVTKILIGSENFTVETLQKMANELVQIDQTLIQGKIATIRGVRKPPKVFAEQGVSMLSAVLRSPTAIEVSIRIMDAFVAMRKA